MRSLVGIAVGIAAVAVVAVVAVAFTAAQGPAEFPPDSPEAALQAYLEAYDEGDYEAAYGHFSADVQDQMAFEEFERVAREYGIYAGESRRVLYDGVGRVEIDGDETKTLQLTVEVSSGGGLAANPYSYQTEVPMVREDGAWRIDQPLVHLDPAPIPAPAYPGTS